MDMKSSEFLSEARGHVAKGWCQQHFFDYRGNVCTIGALRLAQKEANLALGCGQYAESRQVVSNTIHEQYPDGIWVVLACEGDSVSIATWNDYLGRTQEQVLAIFDKAILSLQEAGK